MKAGPVRRLLFLDAFRECWYSHRGVPRTPTPESFRALLQSNSVIKVECLLGRNRIFFPPGGRGSNVLGEALPFFANAEVLP